MNVTLKFRTGEILKGIRSGQYSVPDGCTAREALYAAASENGMVLADHDLEYLFPLLNNHVADWEDTLKDGDSIWFLLVILGG